MAIYMEEMRIINYDIYSFIDFPDDHRYHNKINQMLITLQMIRFN